MKPALNDKERDIVNLLIKGYRRKEIAREMNISVGLVDYYMRCARLKYRTGTVIDLIIVLVQQGEVEINPPRPPFFKGGGER